MPSLTTKAALVAFATAAASLTGTASAQAENTVCLSPQTLIKTMAARHQTLVMLLDEAVEQKQKVKGKYVSHDEARLIFFDPQTETAVMAGSTESLGEKPDCYKLQTEFPAARLLVPGNTADPRAFIDGGDKSVDKQCAILGKERCGSHNEWAQNSAENGRPPVFVAQLNNTIVTLFADLAGDKDNKHHGHRSVTTNGAMVITGAYSDVRFTENWKSIVKGAQIAQAAGVSPSLN